MGQFGQILETFAKSYWWVAAALLLAVFYKQVLRFFGVIIIPEGSIGIVNKKFVVLGKYRTLPDGKIIALNGEAGLQADTLATGLHFLYWPWQYEIRIENFTTIEENTIGVVEARDGHPLGAGRVLGRKVECDSFQDARAFLASGGSRGPQITIIPPGTYRINTGLFSITPVKVLEIPDNMVGVVTTKEGRPLRTGEIAGEEIPEHNMFQDGQVFLDKGGYKGLQEQVILSGRYYINPRFATVEIKEMTIVPIAHAGVVISFVGNAGEDVTGDSFKHGNLVKKGQKGVWIDPLDPGKYPINPLTHKVENVPTANVVLNWATGKTEAHNLDKNLCTITVRSSDGFKFNLDVSQIIHIPRTDAPKVIARFGSVANLVTQVLEPTIGNYFRNAAQGSDAIDFLKTRQERQDDAKRRIGEALQEYNVVAVDTLIGDIVPPDDLMKTLTDRKIADQQQVTYETQRKAEDARRQLQQAKALADTQAKVVDSERTVQIAEYEANAAVKKADGEAQSKKIAAKAEAEVLVVIGEAEAKKAKARAEGEAEAKRSNGKADAEVLALVGRAEADKVTAVGTAEAAVIQKKTDAVGQQNFALIEIGRSLAENKVRLVPEIVAGGGNGAGGNLVDVLIANVLRDSLKKSDSEAGTKKTPA